MCKGSILPASSCDVPCLTNAETAMPCHGERWLRLAFIGMLWKTESLGFFFFFLQQKGQYKYKSWTPINSLRKRAAKPCARLFSSASEMTGSFQTKPGSAFFQCRCVLVLLCPVRCTILKSPTGHLFATMFLAVLHPSCPKIESAQSSKSIVSASCGDN